MGKQDRPPETVGEGTSAWATSPARDLTGKVLGDFHVERRLGQGGIGEVYLARQISLDRPVALKVLRPEWSSNPTYMARFESEAWAAAKLNHPNIIHIYSLGDVDGLRFIAMEYVQGTNLREYLQKKGSPDLPLALSIMRQAGLAVGAAGEAGLTHRDIKPENLMLTRKGQLKVADFGLARLPEAERLHLTAPGMTMGTPMYMSPEQVQGLSVDHRSDLYSLGVSFYHLLAGHPPFRAETAVALALKHVRDEPVSLAEHRPDLPPELVALVMKLMAKAPRDRYPSAGEMLKDLAKVREIVQAAAAEAATQLEVPAAEKSRTQPKLAAAPARRSVGTASWMPRPGLLFAVAAPCLNLGAALGWMARAEDFLSSSSSPPNALPGVWMADWRLVPRQTTAAAQYRYALLRSPGSEREAAWLAVPGRFPGESEWALSAYVQLARHYLRTGDGERLGTLHRELKEAEDRSGSTREKWAVFTRIVHAAEMAVRGDAGEVTATYLSRMNPAIMEPAQAELSLEIINRALESTEGRGAEAEHLNNIRNQLLTPLRLTPSLFDRPVRARK